MSDEQVLAGAAVPSAPEPAAPPPPGRTARVLVIAYAVWTTGAFLLQLLGYADTRSSRDLFTILAEVAVGALALLAWRLRAHLAPALDRARVTSLPRFVLAGLVAAYVSETLFYFAIDSHMSLPVFWLRTLVWYAGWCAAWWWLCRNRGFSAAQVFFLGGLNGFLVEGLILRPVPLTPLGLLLYPLVASLYGATLLVPYALRPAADTAVRRRASAAARFGLSFLPLLAFVPGFIWLALVQIVFGVQ